MSTTKIAYIIKNNFINIFMFKYYRQLLLSLFYFFHLRHMVTNEYVYRNNALQI